MLALQKKQRAQLAAETAKVEREKADLQRTWRTAELLLRRDLSRADLVKLSAIVDPPASKVHSLRSLCQHPGRGLTIENGHLHSARSRT